MAVQGLHVLDSCGHIDQVGRASIEAGTYGIFELRATRPPRQIDPPNLGSAPHWKARAEGCIAMR
ncbi:hypothetical protein Cenrod_1967 [Candidatus Symbiobacter mobilis CR]|uniref:Uncharacterized protein n=1 Tax=Candidatus Symbiobacter mobilis CR TaxID=946483 RepID=U5NCS7_9BURK|nr:hypothetical protein Cenrod_1967 [Candidatus Symbiobacter mobilis CR]